MKNTLRVSPRPTTSELSLRPSTRREKVEKRRSSTRSIKSARKVRLVNPNAKESQEKKASPSVRRRMEPTMTSNLSRNIPASPTRKSSMTTAPKKKVRKARATEVAEAASEEMRAKPSEVEPELSAEGTEEAEAIEAIEVTEVDF